jgi:hypothetical protein
MSDGTDPNTPGAGNQTTVTLNAENWREFVPPELKDDPTLAPIKDLGGLAKSYVNAQKLVGGEKIVLPAGALDTPENWEAVYNKLGRPEAPDKYTLDKGQLPDGLSWNENAEKTYREAAHKLGLTAKQAQGLFSYYNESVAAEYGALLEAEKKAAEDGQKLLKETFGAEADKAGEMAGKVVGLFGANDEHKQGIMELAGRSPALTVLLAKIGQQLREAGLHKGDGAADLASSPEQAQQKKMDIMTNKDNPLNAAYFDKKHPRHAEALETVLQLNGIIMRAQK